MLVGIDLGTTNSLVGIWTEAGPGLVPNAVGHLLTPSVVGLTDDGELIVGSAARERMITHAERTASVFKRYMGTQRTLRLGTRDFRPEELSALVLRSLLADVEAHCGHKPDEAVISVPAYFSDAQRKATRAAGELAGIRVERLVNEPTAAALAYGLIEHRDESKFLVFDLGGGTFDVSILEKFEGVMEVHASAGDNFLGGEDFVDLLHKAAADDLKLLPGRLSKDETAQLRARLERAKCALSAEWEVVVRFVCRGETLEWRIDEARFERLAAPLLQRMRAPIERALRDARLAPSQLDEIVLVGGASRMPMIPRLIARLFGRLPLRHINPEQTVARGAAVMAGMKARSASFREIVMTDVCPYTLGVEVSRGSEQNRVTHGHFSPIIERNTVVPVSRVERYWPMRDFQDVLHLRIFQGEAPLVANNVFLGELEIPLPRRRKDELPFDVRFTYDINGLLEVEATLATDGSCHQLVIEHNPGLLSREEIAERLKQLAQLKVHPRDQQANLAARARAERLYEERLGDARREVGEWLHEFMLAIESQDPRRIIVARERLLRNLDSIDSDVLG